MANLTIVVPDSKVPRVLEAFGEWVVAAPPPGPPTVIIPSDPVWVNATPVQVQHKLEKYVETFTKQYEVTRDARDAAETAQGEPWV